MTLYPEDPSRRAAQSAVPSHGAAELSGPADAKVARAAATLQRLPTAPPGAVDRIVAAAVARNGLDGRRSTRVTWLARAATIMAAAGLGAMATLYGVGRDSVAGPGVVADTGTRESPTASPPSIAYQAAADNADDAPVPTGFALARPSAQRVSVIGAFNGWNASATPMTRDERGVWTATVPLAPGRHAYVFVVDDTVWVTDPRAEVVRDPDYGRDQSV